MLIFQAVAADYDFIMVDAVTIISSAIRIRDNFGTFLAFYFRIRIDFRRLDPRVLN